MYFTVYNTLSVNCFYIKNNWLSLNEHFSIVINQSTFNFLATLIDKNCVVVAEFKKHSFEINGCWPWILTWPDRQVDPLKPRGAILGRRTQIHTLRLKSEKVQFLSISAAMKLKVFWLITIIHAVLPAVNRLPVQPRQ